MQDVRTAVLAEIPGQIFERIVLHWWHFAIPVALLLVIMFASIFSVLLKAARTNPVDSLRYE